jgi:hypothetical protein
MHTVTLFLNFYYRTIAFAELACWLIAQWQWVYFQESITHLMTVAHQMQE